MRGDDFNLNLSAHHNVIWACGTPVGDANANAAAGLLMKGDWNRIYANTIFNVSGGMAGGGGSTLDFLTSQVVRFARNDKEFSYTHVHRLNSAIVRAENTRYDVWLEDETEIATAGRVRARDHHVAHAAAGICPRALS